jgi:peroxin-16
MSRRTETIGISEDVASPQQTQQTMEEDTIEFPKVEEISHSHNRHSHGNGDKPTNLLQTWKRGYDSTLVQNAPQVASLESLLRSLAYFLPGKFKDSEFATETMFAALNLFGMYNDSVLSKHFPTTSTASVWKQHSGVGVQPAPTSSLEMSLHNRYTRASINDGSLYKKLSYGLSTLQFVQIVVEIWARKKFGETGRWRAIVLIEAIK